METKTKPTQKSEDNIHKDHRKRMRQKLSKSPEMLSDHEVVEMILYNVIRRGNTNEQAHKLLDMGGELKGILELKPTQSRLDKYALIQGLPLLINGGIDTNLTFGDVTGAECLVHFNDRDIDSWFDTGESYKPNSKRMHDFSDGFVSLRPHNKNDVIDYEIDGTVLNKGQNKIKITSDSIIVSVVGGCVLTLKDNTATLVGDLIVNGNITASGTITGQTDVIAGAISGKTHTHTSGAPGDPTSSPIGG